MKKKIFTIVCVILVISLLAPSFAFAASGPAPKPPIDQQRADLEQQRAQLEQQRAQLEQQRPQQDGVLKQRLEIKSDILADQLDITDNMKQLMQLRQQIGDLVKQIRDALKGIGENQALVNDPAFLEIKTAMDTIKTELKGLDVRADIRGKIQDFKGFKNKEQLEQAQTKLSEVITTQEDKVAAMGAVITKLNTVLEKAKVFAAANQDKIATYSAIKEEYKVLTKTIQSNHLDIVKLNSEIRDLINKIVATVSANQDSFTDEQKASLNTILTDLKTVKDGLKSALKAGEVKTAIENANKLRKEGKFEEAKAQLEVAISVQNERKTALTDAKAKIEKVLLDINALVATSTTSSETTSSDVVSAA